jgi:hypothetical protein
MTPSPLVIWMGWACYAGAFAAIVIYVIHFAGRQGWKRPWNAAGLFFTAIAMTQTPALFLNSYDKGMVTRAAVVTVCLLAATAVQAYSALRRRRRASDAPPAEGAAG